MRGTVKWKRDLKAFYSQGVAACAKTKINEMMLATNLVV